MAPSQPDVDSLLQEAEEALQEGRLDEAERACRRALSDAPRHADVHLMLGDVLREQGRSDEAEGFYRFVVMNHPEHADGWGALSSVLLDQLRWDEARKTANRALRERPDQPEAAWVRGVLRERRGDIAGAQRDYLRAWRADPDGYPLPVPLPDDTVDEVVSECLEQLHPTLREYLANVPIVLEDVPSEELLRQYDPPAGPTQILGYFTGNSLRERSLDNPWSGMMNAIVLFRRNLERYAHDHEHLLDELRITLFHEIGHFLGLSEEDLEQRGLD